MLQLTLGAALIAGSTTFALPSDPCAFRLPEGASVVFTMGDLAALVSQPAEERSGWQALVADDRMAESMASFMEAFELNAELLPLVGRAMGEVRGGAIGLTFGDGDPEELRMHGALLAGDGFIAALAEFAEAEELPLTEANVDGHPCHVIDLERDGLCWAVMESGDMLLMTSGPRAGAEDALTAMVARGSESLEGEPERRWWDDVEERVPGAQVEVMVNVGLIPPIDDEFEAMQDFISSFYFGMALGDAQASSGIVRVGFAENDIFGRVAGLFGTPSDDLLLLAPEGALGIFSLNLDALAAVQTIVEIVDELDPNAGAGEGYQSALDGGKGALGLDLEEDLLDNFTGDMFMAQWTNADSENPIAGTVMGFMIRDEEPFLELLEAMTPFLEGMGSIVEGDASTSLELAVPGMAFTLTVTSDCVLFGDQDQIAGVAARVGAGAEGAAFSREDVEAAKGLGDGAGYALQDMGLAAEAGLMMLDALGELPFDFRPMFEAQAEHIQGVAYSAFEITASGITVMLLTE